jgi:hypothetical protein
MHSKSRLGLLGLSQNMHWLRSFQIKIAGLAPISPVAVETHPDAAKGRDGSFGVMVQMT